jgi:hypothetical protein
MTVGFQTHRIELASPSLLLLMGTIPGMNAGINRRGRLAMARPQAISQPGYFDGHVDFVHTKGSTLTIATG